MDVLGGSEPHFIKCVKPNSTKSSTKLEPPLVLEQLRYSGILEAVVVRKQGFPTRRTHEDFRGDYWALVKLDRMDVKQNPPVEVCRMIIERLQSRPGGHYHDMHVGKSLVFFRPEVLSMLDGERIVLTERLAIKGQTVWRMYADKKRVRKLAQARALLREAIALGSKNNRGNISIIGSLETNIENCATTLKLHIIEIKSGRGLLQRLKTVEIIFTSLDFALSPQAKSKYEDIFEEYDVMIMKTILKCR
jgi:myosin heavy subunit